MNDSTSADQFFGEAQALRSALTEAEKRDDSAAVAQLEDQLAKVRQKARLAAVDPVAGGEELVALRHQLRKLSQAKRRGWWGRLFAVDGTAHGSADILGSPDLPFKQDTRERIETRIRELERDLIALDAMGDIPPLTPDNINKWW